MIGLTLETRDPAFEDLGPWLDEAEALGLDFAELPLAELPLIIGGRRRARAPGRPDPPAPARR
jgi:hypothetical protein